MKAHAPEKVGWGNQAWPIRGMCGIINGGGRIFFSKDSYGENSLF